MLACQHFLFRGYFLAPETIELDEQQGARPASNATLALGESILNAFTVTRTLAS